MCGKANIKLEQNTGQRVSQGTLDHERFGERVAQDHRKWSEMEGFQAQAVEPLWIPPMTPVK